MAFGVAQTRLGMGIDENFEKKDKKVEIKDIDKESDEKAPNIKSAKD